MSFVIVYACLKEDEGDYCRPAYLNSMCINSVALQGSDIWEGVETVTYTLVLVLLVPFPPCPRGQQPQK
jgi:hypothetical protein